MRGRNKAIVFLVELPVMCKLLVMHQSIPELTVAISADICTAILAYVPVTSIFAVLLLAYCAPAISSALPNIREIFHCCPSCGGKAHSKKLAYVICSWRWQARNVAPFCPRAGRESGLKHYLWKWRVGHVTVHPLIYLVIHRGTASTQWGVPVKHIFMSNIHWLLVVV